MRLKDIINTELGTKRDLTEAKIETIKWVAGMLVAQAALLWLPWSSSCKPN